LEKEKANKQTLVQFLMKTGILAQASVNSTPRIPLHRPVMAVAEDDNVWIMRRIERKTAIPLARAIASRSKHALPILLSRSGNCQSDQTVKKKKQLVLGPKPYT